MFRFTADDLRRFPTRPERKLWEYLRAHRLSGFKFRRQQQIGKYIVDFVCLRQKIIVELDGKVHEGRELYDFMRDKWLSRQGFLVLRFKNEELDENLDGVLDKIRSTLKVRKEILRSNFVFL